MPVVTLKSFGGIAPVLNARLLADSQAQTALNCPVFRGTLTSLPDLGASVHTLTKTPPPKSIYRFGQDVDADDRYWFHWATDVDVCRSQIAGDASEWTFFTGDGAPKATYNSLALSGSNFPTASRPLGLPAPPSAPTANSITFTNQSHAATVTLTPSHIEDITTALQISLDGSSYTTVTGLSSPVTAASVATRVTTITGVTATEDAGTVTVLSTATGPTAKLFVRIQNGTTEDTTSAFNKTAITGVADAAGTANTPAFVVLDDTEIGSIASGDKFHVATLAGATETVHMNDVLYTGALTATAVAAALNTGLTNKVTATVFGTNIILTPDTAGGSATGTITYKRKTGTAYVSEFSSAGSEVGGPARIFLTQAAVDQVEGAHIALTVNGAESKFAVADPSYVNTMRSLAVYGLTVEVHGNIEPVAIISTIATGTLASLSLKKGVYASTAAQYVTQSSVGYTDADSVLQARVYAYTWVNKESGFEFESAPSAASTIVEVRDDQTVEVTGLDSTPGGEYIATHKRIYRSVSGVFLFVSEVGIADASFVDDVKPDLLGEQLFSTTWALPPAELQGLTNLPNGMMAGFVGRDVYFCDPYHPHAWPENYIQTLDYPIVGLGSMDTTLAVLTKGHPYFMQGVHPEGMAVVKSDLEQACVSKRSIVNIMGSVVYAAPDGLMLLSSGGSRILTENLFDRSQWQGLKPESIHAYQQDNMYVAFYDSGTTQGGFVYDVQSGQLILHDIYVDAGYHSLLRDELFVVGADKLVKKWYGGAAKNYVWKSKKFTMPHIIGFSCAQLEAEAYPMTVKLYADGVLIHTQTVTSREPFRLPAKVGRDWEFQIEGSKEVFSFAMANSMTELANG